MKLSYFNSFAAVLAAEEIVDSHVGILLGEHLIRGSIWNRSDFRRDYSTVDKTSSNKVIKSPEKILGTLILALYLKAYKLGVCTSWIKETIMKNELSKDSSKHDFRKDSSKILIKHNLALQTPARGSASKCRSVICLMFLHPAHDKILWDNTCLSFHFF